LATQIAVKRGKGVYKGGDKRVLGQANVPGTIISVKHHKKVPKTKNSSILSFGEPGWT
jgi:hypothetical protein